MNLVEVKNLRLSFDHELGSTQVLRGVDLSIAEGEIVGLVGESGSGKSLTGLSLLNLAGRSAIVTADTLSVAGHDLLTIKGDRARKYRGEQVGMVFQNPTTSLDPHFRVGKQLEEVLRVRGGLKRSEAAKTARSLLVEVGLEETDQVMKSFPHQLSGGMNQRVMIALAISLRPKLLIADEATTALDVTTQERILELFKALSEDRGMAVLFVSHDLGVVKSICDRVAVMYAGTIVEEGKKDVLLKSPIHPYTQALLASRPKLQGKMEELVGIDGRPPQAGAKIESCAFAPRCSQVVDDCLRSIPATRLVGTRSVACFLPQRKEPQ